MQTKVEGSLSQFVEVVLAAGEEVYADPGTLVYKDAALYMEARLQGGFGTGLKRILAGLALNRMYFVGPGRMSLSKNRSGKVLALPLAAGESIDVHPGAFVFAEASVGFELLPLDLHTGIFGGAGFFWARLTGPGQVFLQTWGDYQKVQLGDGEALQVAPGHLVYKSRSVHKVVSNVSMKNAVFGGFGAFLVTVMGPGEVCFQARTRTAAGVTTTRVDVRPPTRPTPQPK